MSNQFILILTGLFAGFVDSIAGGGGLITIPVLSLILQPGPEAIGTNKIAGAVAAAVALLVYMRKGHFNFRKAIIFSIAIGSGSFLGSLTSPYLPVQAFRWFLVITCPLILWIVWRKDLWVEKEIQKSHAIKNKREKVQDVIKIIGVGLLCGFYDGVWGPGGGTFMFLSLLFIAHLPLLMALAISKFANAISASMALIGYTLGGHVHWLEGIFLALGISLGAFLGARFASRNAAIIIRPILAIVVGLLILRLF